MATDDLALAQRLADAAGAAIRPWFRRPFLVETKADFSPVTAADREAEAVIRRLLDEYRPHDGVIGEEYGDDRPDAARVWVLDPIDGTRAFVAGRPLFGTLIALLEDGKPVLGIIDQCIIGDRWLAGPGQPTLFNGQRCHVRRCPQLAEARIGTTSPHAFPEADFAAFERARGAVGDTLYGGDCHNYGLVAAGHLDAVVEAGLKLHDWAALVPIVTGAGGVMSDWQGQPLDMARSDGRVIAAGDAAVAAAIAAALAD
ncbi:inositol monophosphatase family protein [Sandarakinorhabdus rubra]|uniref:inositol monophosphatase family protein n=1 Tax=Sandarakinorhabdus rubra TaxID=2672568 RepID=UPI0013D9F824|nr:inositol monophosphatase family protein [Sandarakinorhabdus rubra]